METTALTRSSTYLCFSSFKLSWLKFWHPRHFTILWLQIWWASRFHLVTWPLKFRLQRVGGSTRKPPSCLLPQVILVHLPTMHCVAPSFCLRRILVCFVSLLASAEFSPRIITCMSRWLASFFMAWIWPMSRRGFSYGIVVSGESRSKPKFKKVRP